MPLFPQWLSKEYSNTKISLLSHMIELPENDGNLGVELGIFWSATFLGMIWQFR